ncbi:MAG: hypothetical protein HDS27_06185 [Bacteroides sp.]|nr:hypothetical protein [Bacteroides sp.]
MNSALDFLDSTTKDVVKLIVEKYQKDISTYSNSTQIHSLNIGIGFTELINDITNCVILSTGRDSKSFGIKFTTNNNKGFSSVLESTTFHANKGVVLETQVLQIIDFLIRLKDEGVILFTQIDFGKPIKKPTYKSLVPENNGTMFFTIQEKRINEFIDEIYYSNIIPTVGLIGFKKRDYKTIDQEQFESSQCLSYIGVIAAIIIAILSPILMTYCSTSTINENQFNSLIKVIQSKDNVIHFDSVNSNNHFNIINGKITNEKP